MLDFQCAVVVFLGILVQIVLATIVERNDESFIVGIEAYFSMAGLRLFSEITLILGKTISLTKRRQKSEMAEFLREYKEIIRCFQRYEYFVKRCNALKRESHPLGERQESQLTEAIRELESLTCQVYELSQSLEENRQRTRNNLWIRHYLLNLDRSYWRDDRDECAGRLGCCADSCGCCGKSRGLSENGPDIHPGERFMRMARKWNIGGRNHCSIDCGCCIQRRGFRIRGEGESGGESEGEGKGEGRWVKGEITLPVQERWGL